MSRASRGGDAPKLPVRRVAWRPCIRIIPSRYPPLNLFERVADATDLEAVIAVESLTNDRLRQEVGDISLLAAVDRVTGPGSSYIMAPFTHPAPAGGRFSDSTFGAYYTARSEETAIAETRYHRERFMRATAEPRMELGMRMLSAALDGRLHDARGLERELPAIYDPDDYRASQALARELRGARAWGIAYASVRHAGGECAAIFRPPALSNCRQTRHLAYLWDGDRISQVYEKRLRA